MPGGEVMLNLNHPRLCCLGFRVQGLDFKPQSLMEAMLGMSSPARESGLKTPRLRLTGTPKLGWPLKPFETY